MGCKAGIKVTATADGSKLVVKSYNETHNHTVNKEVFKNLFQQRRLNNNEKTLVSDFLTVKANKKHVQSQLKTISGKTVHLKDIHNISTHRKETSKQTENFSVLQETVNTLNTAPGAFVKIFSDENNEFKGLYFQDARMRETFSLYPEFVCIDATYKLNDLRMPLYTMLVENGNGQSEVVGMWLVVEETDSMISEMVKLFQQQNAKWENVKTVMTDKDFIERDVFSRLFPGASLRLCLFHVLQTLRRQITIEKMGITKVQRDAILNILQSIAYSKSETEYDANVNILKDTNCQKVIEYFNSSWHPLKHQWVVGFSTPCSFGNNTNNRIESINQKIKQSIGKHSALNEFATDFLVFLGSHRTEINAKATKTSSKVPISHIPSHTAESRYLTFLTPHAYKLIKTQIDRHASVTLVTDDAVTTTEDGRISVKSTECTCAFYVQHELPCKHIFALRHRDDIDLYDETLIQD